MKRLTVGLTVAALLAAGLGIVGAVAPAALASATAPVTISAPAAIGNSTTSVGVPTPTGSKGVMVPVATRSDICRFLTWDQIRRLRLDSTGPFGMKAPGGAQCTFGTDVGNLAIQYGAAGAAQYAALLKISGVVQVAQFGPYPVYLYNQTGRNCFVWIPSLHAFVEVQGNHLKYTIKITWKLIVELLKGPLAR